MRWLPSAYFLRKAARGSNTKELLATPIPYAGAPKRLELAMTTHAGVLPFWRLPRLRLPATVAYST